MLAGGALSIRRTNKDFSRVAVDLTLEQTINADVTSRLTGIAAFGHGYGYGYNVYIAPNLLHILRRFT